MRKISYYLLLGLLGVGFYGCNKDNASAPPQPSFTVDKTAGNIGDTFTFTVNQVSADAITLFPYGMAGSTNVTTAEALGAGILLLPTDFSGGKATVTFSYNYIGTFNAVVQSNNHNASGSSIKNVVSSGQTITIGSNMNSLLTFGLLLNPTVPADSASFFVLSFPKTNNNLTLLLPYGNGHTQTNLATGAKAVYSSSPYSTVTVSSSNFTSPVTITVTAADGAAQTYTLTATVSPVEKTKSFTAQAKDVSKSAKNKILPASVDSVAGKVVVYDTLGSLATDFDSLRFEYTFKGSFAVLKYGTSVLKQDSLFNLSSSTKNFVAHGQDSTSQSYTVYAVAAPKLTLAFSTLIPAVKGKTTNFGISADVLSGTDVTSLVTSSMVDLPSGVTVTGMTANGSPFISGDIVDYTSPVEFVLSVNDPVAGAYLVTYTVTVNVVN